MESPPPLELPLGDQPHSLTPGSLPLRNARRERYCRLRVLGVSPIAAAREAGFTAGLETKTAEHDKTAGLRGVASKLEKGNSKGAVAVRERIAFLAGNDDEVLRAKRRRIEERLNDILDAPIKDVMVGVPALLDDEGGVLLPARIALDVDRVAQLPQDERAILFSTIKAVTVTPGGAVKLEPYSALDAAAQLRALNGLDAPKRVEMSGPGGGPVETSHSLDLSRLTDDQLAAFADLYRAAAVNPGD